MVTNIDRYRFTRFAENIPIVSSHCFVRSLVRRCDWLRPRLIWVEKWSIITSKGSMLAVLSVEVTFKLYNKREISRKIYFVCVLFTKWITQYIFTISAILNFVRLCLKEITRLVALWCALLRFTIRKNWSKTPY